MKTPIGISTLLLIFFLSWHIPASAQKKTGQSLIDSLKSELNKNVADTQRCKLLAKICFLYNSINTETGIGFGTEALALATKLNWEKGQAEARYYRGSCYLNSARYPEALEDYLQALKYYEKTGNRDRLAGLLSNIGGVYSYQEKNKEALTYFFKALALNRQDKIPSNFEVANLGNIGLIYYNQNEFEKALQYFSEALEVCRKGKFQDMEPFILVGISGVYVKMEMYPAAIDYARKTLKITKGNDYLNATGNCFLNIGISQFRIVSKHKTKWLDSLYQGNTQFAVKLAKHNLDTAVQILKTLGDDNMLLDAYRELSALEEYRGDLKEALRFHKLLHDLRDTIYNASNKEKILQAAMEYEFEKKEAKTRAEQEKKDIRQRNIRNLIIAGLLAVLVFATLVLRQRNRISRERKKSDDLLLNILPEEVAAELKANGKAEARFYQPVTVLFSDFKGFTLIAEKLSPAELVNEIDFYFKSFDNIIEKYRIEKIKTIGDAYMCAAGLPVPSETHAADMVAAALEMQSFVKSVQEERKLSGLPAFEIRIGINTGSVVAGIVGNKKFAYDIWGDAVNIAARMESSGQTGRVNISGSTYNAVKELYRCEYRGKVEAKNKGEIDMYFVDGPL